MKAPKFSPGFIQTQVGLHLRGTVVQLPPVIGRSLADSIARMIRVDFPFLVVTTEDVRHSSHAGLADALATSDSVASQLELALSSHRPGEQLLQRLGMLHEVRAGGAE